MVLQLLEFLKMQLQAWEVTLSSGVSLLNIGSLENAYVVYPF